MLTLAQMLEKLLKDKGLKQKVLAERLGIKPSSVNQWVKGTSRPDPSRLAQIAQELGVTVDDLLGGSLPVVEHGRGEFSTGNVGSVKVNIPELYTLIPFLSAKAQTQLPTMQFENCNPIIEETFPVLISTFSSSDRQLAIEIVGDSMEPEIKNGAIVLAERINANDIKYESGGVYAVMYANRFVIKRIKTNDINSLKTLTLWSDNERYGHITIAAEDISCMWKVLMKVSEVVR
jgi:transcriptional regulator with XRE-family HTH domain